MSARRLFGAAQVRICAAMRTVSLIGIGLAALVLALAAPVQAQKPPVEAGKAAGPRAIGSFQDWLAATHVQGGQPVCYALTRAKASAPAIPGRGEVVLTVTQRPNLRDAVAISAGFAYAAKAEVKVEAGSASFDFYTAQRSAFAREGAKAVAAFVKAGEAVAKSPGPRGVVTDTFSLKGFSAAYAAISKACPAK